MQLKVPLMQLSLSQVIRVATQPAPTLADEIERRRTINRVTRGIRRIGKATACALRVMELLERVARSGGDWKRIYEAENLIALEKDGASITLEPGGQLELSGAALENIHETCSEVHDHLDQVKAVADPLEISLIA